MTMMSKILILVFLFFVVSCKSYDINPGSERIRVFDAEPKGCVYVGEVSAVQEDVVPSSVVGDQEMTIGTRVDLRNKAHALGGNILVFMDKNRGKDKKQTAAPAAAAAKKVEATAEEDKSDKKLTTVFLATVFRCPSAILNQ